MAGLGFLNTNKAVKVCAEVGFGRYNYLCASLHHVPSDRFETIVSVERNASPDSKYAKIFGGYLSEKSAIKRKEC